MNYEIKFTPDFELDLAEMDYNLIEFPQIAKQIILKIENVLLPLRNMPQIYPVYEDFPIFRKIVIEDYLLFYLIDEDKKQVEIHRLIHVKMDLKNCIKS